MERVTGLRASTSYDEIDAPAAMRVDARAARRTLRLEVVARAVAEGPPSLRYDDHPVEVAKPEIVVAEAAARIAAALNLYVD